MNPVRESDVWRDALNLTTAEREEIDNCYNEEEWRWVIGRIVRQRMYKQPKT